MKDISKKINVSLTLTILILLFCSGCLWAKNVAQNAEGRKNEIHNFSPKVLRAYRWHTFEDMSQFLLPAKAAENLGKLQKFYSNHKVKEVEVEGVEFDGSEDEKAYMTLTVKTFSSPRYVVENHLDQLTWEYSSSNGGWKIVRIDVGAAQGIVEDDSTE
ncbi:MAG TPA: hypothetical protein PKA63_08475 [Oligoflexia bacterium]|nr:hypothetical protein [Oligoflexia bacterium]HMP48685.1 hypothetical protein [Oligoflexia bacterium]